MKTTTTLFLILFLKATLVISEKCHPEDKKVLLRIKKSFNNPKLYSSWDPTTDCCNWKWVGCDSKTNRVFDFYIYDTHETLNGPFFPDIGDLPYLTTIEINGQPNLTGPIPSSLTNLKSLSYFSVSQSGLSGQIPDFLGEIKTLTGLVLHSNNLSGTIPESLGRLKKLVVLSLGRNRLSGGLPAWLGRRNFTNLDLSQNKFEGDASTLFGESTKNALTVDLSKNLLEFNLSKVKRFPKGVVLLDITDNIFI